MDKVTKIFVGFLALYFVSLALPAIWTPAIDTCAVRGLLCVDWISALALTGAITVGLYALFRVLTAKRIKTEPAPSSQMAYPYGETVYVLIWLVAVFIIYFVLFIRVMVPETIDESSVYLFTMLDNKMIQEATVAFLAAGIGSTISTSFSYLLHASSEADWKSQFTPWYILRPIQGSVLGVIFFWLMKGGILAVLPAQDGDAYLDLDLTGLAGVCALVGMFSRRAMNKLREIFTVIFVINEKKNGQKPEPQNGQLSGSAGEHR